MLLSENLLYLRMYESNHYLNIIVQIRSILIKVNTNKNVGSVFIGEPLEFAYSEEREQCYNSLQHSLSALLVPGSGPDSLFLLLCIYLIISSIL